MPFLCQPEETDLDYQREAAGQPGRAARRPNLLSRRFHVRFRQRAILIMRNALRTGSVSDLDTAIDQLRKTRDAIPAGSPGSRPLPRNLRMALGARFERSGLIEDLDEAIVVGREAVAASADPNRPVYLINLGLVLWNRYGQSGSLDDLDEFISVSSQALGAPSGEHPERALFLRNLGAGLLTRFRRSGSAADLDEAIAVFRLAVAASASNHAEHAAWPASLRSALTERFKLFDRAIVMCGQAAAASASDHPDRFEHLGNLCIALKARLERLPSEADVDALVKLHSEI